MIRICRRMKIVFPVYRLCPVGSLEIPEDRPGLGRKQQDKQSGVTVNKRQKGAAPAVF